MSQQDNFSGGFILGAVLGGIAGGVLGSILASRMIESEAESAESETSRLSDPKPTGKRSLRVAASTEGFEVTGEPARKSLEDKIAQLNNAIDDVRDQLKRVNGGPGQVRSSIETPPNDISESG
jgi:hypothetical protein